MCSDSNLYSEKGLSKRQTGQWLGLMWIRKKKPLRSNRSRDLEMHDRVTAPGHHHTSFRQFLCPSIVSGIVHVNRATGLWGWAKPLQWTLNSSGSESFCYTDNRYDMSTNPSRTAGTWEYGYGERSFSSPPLDPLLVWVPNQTEKENPVSLIPPPFFFTSLPLSIQTVHCPSSSLLLPPHHPLSRSCSHALSLL